MWPYARRKKQEEEKKERYYVGVVCARCRSYIPWVEDPSCGKVRLIFEAPLITLACPSCGLKGNYPTNSLVSFPEDTGAH
jgi:ribosomal protein S27E